MLWVGSYRRGDRNRMRNFRGWLGPSSVAVLRRVDSADTTRSLRRRRGIFVEPQPKQNFSPDGAAYSEDVAPERSLVRFVTVIYKDASPTGLKNPCSSVSIRG